MKIIYCIPWLFNPGGMERVLSSKANYFAEVFGHEIVIVTSDNRNRSVYFPLHDSIRVIHMDVPERTNTGGFLCRRWEDKRTRSFHHKALAKILYEERADFCISMVAGDEFYFLPRINDGSIKIAESHYSTDYYHGVFHGPGHPLKKMWRKRLFGKFIRAASQYASFVVLTKADQHNWANRLNNISQVYNPVSFKSRDVPALADKKVIAVGRLSEEKGYDYLLRVWADVAIRNDLSDWQLDIYGGGHLKDHIFGQIQRMPPGVRVRLHTPVSGISAKLLESSIYVMTSQTEGLPLALMESMECGLPAVAFNCNYGPGELIENGRSGFLIPLNDTSSFAERLIALMESHELRATMGSRAKTLAQAFKPEHIAGQWTALFQELQKAAKS